MARRAILNVHAHNASGGVHKDVRIFLLGEDGKTEGVHHFSSPVGLPSPGRIARWKTLDDPHVDPGTMEAADGRHAHELTEEVEMTPHESGGKTLYINGPSGKYVVAESGDTYYVKNMSEAEKIAGSPFDYLQTNPIAQALAVTQARRMGFIPPNLMVPGPDEPPAPPGLIDKAEAALGMAVKTVALGALGGFGASLGWNVGGKVFGKKEKNAAGTGPEEDPADAPLAEGESPIEYRPEAPGLNRLADAAATTHSQVGESLWGHQSGDPL